jgi:V8-like Glu-specific endopeptidase
MTDYRMKAATGHIFKDESKDAWLDRYAKKFLGWAIVASALFLILVSCGHMVPAYADWDERTPVKTYINPIVHTAPGCTAWHVGSGFVVTASHCVTPLGDQTRLELILSDGRHLKGAQLAFLANTDVGMDDFAVLHISIPGDVDWGLLNVDCSVPPVRTEVTVTGFPGLTDGLLTTNWGHISTGLADNFEGWLHAIIVDMTVSGGYSGSPAQRTSDGKVVGVIVGSAVKSPYAVMIPMKKLCAVLEIDKEGHVE